MSGVKVVVIAHARHSRCSWFLQSQISQRESIVELSRKCQYILSWYVFDISVMDSRCGICRYRNHEQRE